jgi:hypothetical protein
MISIGLRSEHRQEENEEAHLENRAAAAQV